MNRYHLYTLGGALLAATSLSGAASGASVGYYIDATGFAGISSSGPITFAATSLLAAATAADNIGRTTSTVRPVIVFQNSYDPTFNVAVTLSVSGAAFSGSPGGNSVFIRSSAEASGTITATVGAVNLTGSVGVSALSTQIFVTSLNLTGVASTGGAVTALIAGVSLDGLAFNNLHTTMGTAGNSISLSGPVFKSGDTNVVYETLTSSPVITAVEPLSGSIAAGTAVSVDAASAPNPFLNITGGTLTVNLANVYITGVNAYGTDLSLPLGVSGGDPAAFDTGTGSLSLLLASAALADPAAATVILTNSTSTLSTVTTAAFTSGSVSFTYANTVTFGGTTVVLLGYDGTTQISAAAAGTLVGSFAAGGAANKAAASLSGATTVVTRGGLSAEINWANNGTSAYTSYVRIHNSGNLAATATITVRDDATGLQLGTTTYTTASVPGNGTIQVSVPTIETSLGLTPASSYTLQIAGGFPGYAQHVSFNATTGALVDLSGFRNGGAAAQP